MSVCSQGGILSQRENQRHETSLPFIELLHADLCPCWLPLWLSWGLLLFQLRRFLRQPHQRLLLSQPQRLLLSQPQRLLPSRPQQLRLWRPQQLLLSRNQLLLQLLLQKQRLQVRDLNENKQSYSNNLFIEMRYQVGWGHKSNYKKPENSQDIESSGISRWFQVEVFNDFRVSFLRHVACLKRCFEDKSRLCIWCWICSVTMLGFCKFFGTCGIEVVFAFRLQIWPKWLARLAPRENRRLTSSFELSWCGTLADWMYS